MLKWIVRIVLCAAIVVVAVVAFGWSVLAIPFFSDWRSALVSDILSEQIGQPLLVNGDVSVVVGPTSRVRALGVQIPSENLPDVDLAKLDSFEFDIDLFALLDRRIDLNNLFVDGLQVNLLVTEDGTTSFNESEKNAIGSKSSKPTASTDAEATEKQETDNEQGGLIAFLKTRTVSFSNVGLIINDETTGFEYDFSLVELALEQLEGGAEAEVRSNGAVNGQTFTLKGNYPEGAPFKTRAEFSSFSLTFDGEPYPSESGGGYTGLLSIDLAGIGDFLDVLKLKRSFDGSGRFNARIENSAGVTAVSDIDAQLQLEKGQLITITGDIADVNQRSGFDIQFNARLHPENEEPPQATQIADLKLTQIEMEIVTQNEALELDGLVLSTNAFQRELEKVGPVSIGRIRRTEEGTLAFENISLQAGPLNDPFLSASGDINNILELSDLDLAGEINAPATLILTSLDDASAEAFGGVEAEFAIDDAGGILKLNKLIAQAVDTDIWTMQADIEVSNVKEIEGLAAEFKLEIASGATFLEALGKKPIDTGAFAFDLSVQGEDGFIKGGVGLASGTSRIDSSVSMGEESGRQTLRVSLESDALIIDDLKNGVAAISELRKIGDTTASPDSTTDEAANQIEPQPLVLPRTKPDNDEPKKQGTGNETEAKDEKTQRAAFDEFLRKTDVYGSVEFKGISGVQGVTSLSSELVSENGKARLGPVEFSYGGGYFNFEASADVIEAPQYVSVAGATSGWTLAEVLDLAGVSFDADGDLSGRFDVAGNLASVQTFLDTMKGSASVKMLDGRIATSLLELAGLGIFPWLFSDEFRQGYTDVVCVNIPVSLDGGAVSFDNVVAETKSVQLVAKGNVDIERGTISVRAEPRPVGKPLSRSAWPFDVTGQLSNPKFKLDVGGSLSKRADGADEMPADRTPCQPDILQLQ